MAVFFTHQTARSFSLCPLRPLHYISISLLFLDSTNLDPIVHGHVGGVEKRLIFRYCVDHPLLAWGHHRHFHHHRHHPAIIIVTTVVKSCLIDFLACTLHRRKNDISQYIEYCDIMFFIYVDLVTCNFEYCDIMFFICWPCDLQLNIFVSTAGALVVITV